MTAENRLVDLEIKLAYQEDASQKLNEALLIQQRRIDQLEQLCRELQERVRTFGDGPMEVSAASSLDEVPPHY